LGRVEIFMKKKNALFGQHKIVPRLSLQSYQTLPVMAQRKTKASGKESTKKKRQSATTSSESDDAPAINQCPRKKLAHRVQLEEFEDRGPSPEIEEVNADDAAGPENVSCRS
jgi:hypothetical protein